MKLTVTRSQVYYSRNGALIADSEPRTTCWQQRAIEIEDGVVLNRVQTPGGWLTWPGTGTPSAFTFVPDPDGSWEWDARPTEHVRYDGNKLVPMAPPPPQAAPTADPTSTVDIEA